MSKSKLELAKELQEKAIQIRTTMINICNRVGGAHLGGCLSACDAVVALYYKFMNVDVKNYNDSNRDRFILSKGHNCTLMLSVFVDKGAYTMDEVVAEYDKLDGRFGMHPDRKNIPEFDASSGSLGQGLPLAVGRAMAGRADKKDWRVFCAVGDGELDEGSNWEAMMAAAHYKLGNLVAIVDRNHIQVGTTTENTLALEPLADKWRAFGWDVRVVEDGNNMLQLVEAFSNMPPVSFDENAKPICFMLNTVKGAGVDYMENNYRYHFASVNDDILPATLESIKNYKKI